MDTDHRATDATWAPANGRPSRRPVRHTKLLVLCATPILWLGKVGLGAGTGPNELANFELQYLRKGYADACVVVDTSALLVYCSNVATVIFPGFVQQIDPLP